MNFDSRNRRWHSRIAWIIAIPFILVIATGLLLQLKKHWSWVQPSEQKGTDHAPWVSLDAIMKEMMAHPELRLTGWQDVVRGDLRPSKGLGKFTLSENREVQVDLGTGKILKIAVRRSDWLESIHDGSFFAGDWSKLGIFLPVGVLALFLWASGVRLLLVPWIMRRRRARK